MTRDMDVIRSLLLRVEQLSIPAWDFADLSMEGDDLAIEGIDRDAVIYNLRTVVAAL